MSHKKIDIHIAILGAGIAGISTGIALKTRLKFTNFTIFEQETEVGGTWRANTYPGCACDVPSHWYSLSSDPNPDWSNSYSSQPEILHYWKSLASRYSLNTYIRLRTRVEASDWDHELQAYQLVVRNLATGAVEHLTAQIVVSAIGGFLEPLYADLPGKDVFKGDMWHSARWNHNVSLAGKKVAVIGNGCSAAQFIPEIAKESTTTIVNFCRTPNWFVPRFQATFPAVVRWLFKYIPGILRLYRALIMARMDLLYNSLFRKPDTWGSRLARKQLTRYMKKVAPQKYHDELIPKYAPGCKRMILDPGYLKCLHQDNVDLNWNAIARITETGVVTKAGESFNFDVIIFGTGFDVLNTSLKVKGSLGQDLRSHWGETFPAAYLGTTIPGFPNFFVLLGPNVATGHASVIFSEEAQINYMMRIIKPILDGKVKSFEVKASACDAYNEDIQNRLRKSVWMGCNSYYRSGGNGKIYATYPGPVTRFWWSTLVPEWNDYKANDVHGWRPTNRILGFLKAIFVL